MEKLIYKEEDFSSSKWSGGNTKELAVFPKGSKYSQRDFIWRLSSATVDDEESDFTRLSDYERILMVLEGEAVLTYGSESFVHLQEGEQDSFDGDTKTKCFGKIRDYNLMFRKGGCGRLELITAENNSKAVPCRTVSGAKVKDSANPGVASMSGVSISGVSYGFYCLSGYIIVTIDGEVTMVHAGEQLIVNFDDDLEKAAEDAGVEDKDEAGGITYMGDGKGIMAEIFYGEEDHTEETTSKITNDKATATAEDFKIAFKLAHSKNRWKQALNKGNDKVCYDELMQKKLRFLEKSYITFIIWILGAVVFGSVAAVNSSPGKAMLLIVVWTAFHLLFTAPFIYMIFLPKPIGDHMKNVEELTAVERAVHETSKNENERTEKLLKRYKKSGRNDYTDDE